jgi:hypothetical protein
MKINTWYKNPDPSFMSSGDTWAIKVIEDRYTGFFLGRKRIFKCEGLSVIAYHDYMSVDDPGQKSRTHFSLCGNSDIYFYKVDEFEEVKDPKEISNLEKKLRELKEQKQKSDREQDERVAGRKREIMEALER